MMNGFVQKEVKRYLSTSRRASVVFIGIGVLMILLHYVLSWGRGWMYGGGVFALLGLAGFIKYLKLVNGPIENLPIYKEFSKFGNPLEIMESINMETAGGILKKPDISSILDANLYALKSGTKPNFTPFYVDGGPHVITPSWVIKPCPQIICLSRLDDLIFIYLETVEHEALHMGKLSETITWHCIFLDGYDLILFPEKSLQGIHDKIAPILAVAPWAYVNKLDLMNSIDIEKDPLKAKEILNVRKQRLREILLGHPCDDSEEKADLEWNLSYIRGETLELPGFTLDG